MAQDRLRGWFDRVAKKFEPSDSRPSMFSTPSADDRGFVPLIAVIAFLILLPGAWPVSLYLVGAIICWRFVRSTDNVLSRAITGFLLPAIIGLFLLCLLVLVVNSLSRFLSADDLAATEIALAASLGAFQEWSEWLEPPSTLQQFGRILIFIPIMIILVFITYIHKEWRAIPKYLALKKALSFLITMLTIVTTFTFFSREPAVGWRDQARAYVLRTTMELEGQERACLARFAAAETLKKAAATLGPLDVMRINSIARMIDDETLKPESVKFRRAVFKFVAIDFIADVKKTSGIDEFLKRKPLRYTETPSTVSARDLTAGLQRIKKQRNSAEEAENLEKEDKELLTDTAKSLLSKWPMNVLHVSNQTLEVLIGAIFDELVDSIFKRLSSTLAAGADRRNDSERIRARSIELPEGISRELLALPRPQLTTPSSVDNIFNQFTNKSNSYEFLYPLGGNRVKPASPLDERLEPFRATIRNAISMGRDWEAQKAMERESNGESVPPTEPDPDIVVNYLARERASESHVREVTHGPVGTLRSSKSGFRAEFNDPARYEPHEEFHPIEFHGAP